MFYFKLLTTVLKHASSRNVCILSSNVHDRHKYPLIYYNPFFTFIAWWYLVFLISFSLTFFVFLELAFPVLLFCLLVFFTSLFAFLFLFTCDGLLSAFWFVLKSWIWFFCSSCPSFVSLFLSSSSFVWT